MDDGSPICLCITINESDGSAVFDFEGRSPAASQAGPAGNIRPRARTRARSGSCPELRLSTRRTTLSRSGVHAGTGLEVYGNCNAPPAVTYSAIIYCLRCLVAADLPLNQGCLTPITIRIPRGSLLHPSEQAAVVGGNVLTSQRVTDVVLKGGAAFQQPSLACARSSVAHPWSFSLDPALPRLDLVSPRQRSAPVQRPRAA